VALLIINDEKRFANYRDRKLKVMGDVENRALAYTAKRWTKPTESLLANRFWRHQDEQWIG
jgi:hypothetical protein